MQLRKPPTGKRVLVLGIYLADQEHATPHIVGELGRSLEWDVEQRWIALGRGPVCPAVDAVTVDRLDSPVPKFTVLNRLLAAAAPGPYAFVVFCDDDILLPPGFVDSYLGLVCRHDFALCQPARTHDSYIDHPFVEQLDGITARRTRFVEIGPLFSVRHDAVPLLTPFDESSPMGWGYDLAWPCVLEASRLKQGIVDAVPVTHAMRKPVARYDYESANRQMREYLARRQHLSSDEAFFIVEVYD